MVTRVITREGTVKEGYGRRANVTFDRMEQALGTPPLANWVCAMPPVGDVYEQMVLVDRRTPLADIVREYASGRRAFSRKRIEALVGASISQESGAGALGELGFAVVACADETLELRAADPREAKLVNAARCGPYECQLGAVLRAFLHLQEAPGWRFQATSERRRSVVQRLRELWDVEIDWFVARGEMVRLRSAWMYEEVPCTTALGPDVSEDTLPRAAEQTVTPPPPRRYGRISQVVEEL
jgi:hypothetical protein